MGEAVDGGGGGFGLLLLEWSQLASVPPSMNLFFLFFRFFSNGLIRTGEEEQERESARRERGETKKRGRKKLTLSRASTRPGARGSPPRTARRWGASGSRTPSARPPSGRPRRSARPSARRRPA